MADAQWEYLKQAMREANTPEARRAAAEAMREYQKSRRLNSRPIMVSLGKDNRAVPIGEIADRMEQDPSFFEKMKRIIRR